MRIPVKVVKRGKTAVSVSFGDIVGEGRTVTEAKADLLKKLEWISEQLDPIIRRVGERTYVMQKCPAGWAITVFEGEKIVVGHIIGECDEKQAKRYLDRIVTSYLEATHEQGAAS